MRNFLYNKSDILVAVIIIVVAAIIIWTRVNAIMDTPKEAGDKPANNTEQNVADQSGGTTTPAAVTSPPATETTDGGVTEGNPPPPDSEPSGDEDGAAEGETVQFTVDVGSAASTVADNLASKGLVDSADAFLNELKAQNAETKLKAGNFKIKSGTSVADIVKKLTN
jgi:cell division protein YceG involved in septum cleavage